MTRPQPTQPSRPRFPGVRVQLTGTDSNAFNMAARVRKALEQAGHTKEAEVFFREALSKDYHHVIATCGEYVHVS